MKHGKITVLNAKVSVGGRKAVSEQKLALSLDDPFILLYITHEEAMVPHR